ACRSRQTQACIRSPGRGQRRAPLSKSGVFAMGRRRSWAEGRWWRGAKTDPLFAVIFVIAVVFGFPLLMMWRVSPALQRYYTSVYANSCGSGRLPMVLPYIQWANGARTLASNGQVFALAPAPSGAPRFTLSQAAIRTGARKLEF